MKSVVINTILILAVLGMNVPIFAQKEFKMTTSSAKLSIKGLNKLVIEEHSGKEIILINNKHSDESSERAKGLTAINSLGLKDNTGLGLSATEVNGELQIVAMSSRSSHDYRIKVPKGKSITFEHSGNSMHKLKLVNCSGEIEVSLRFGSVYLENITGPAAVNTVHGHIEATYSSLNGANPSTLYSAHGHVDVTLPANTKANVMMATGFGQMYTDFDVKVQSSEGGLSPSEFEGTINGGGTEIKLTSRHNDIYLRKA